MPKVEKCVMMCGILFGILVGHIFTCWGVFGVEWRAVVELTIL